MFEKGQSTPEEYPGNCEPEALLEGRSLIVVSNRGPASFSRDEDGTVKIQRGGGGLVTALLGLAKSVDISWIAAAIGDLEKEWGWGEVEIGENGRTIDLHLIPIDEDIYNGYYNVISNPLLWFIQHSMWDFVSGPNINRDTWKAWDQGYAEANRKFAQTVAQHIKAAPGRSLVMLQDYHLYLLPRMLRRLMRRTRRSRKVTLTHFVHIPWPGSEELRILPSRMRKEILDGLCAVDLLGFQTREDVLNFLQSVESHLPGTSVNYKHRRVWYRNHATIVCNFPISIDVPAIKEMAGSPETQQQRTQFEEMIKGQQLILRVDRTDPSKNIVRGFQSFGEMLELHPEHHGKVKFIALLVPSRLDVDEYHDYHNKIMAAAGWVNSQFGTSEWEPIRVMIGENYPGAVAALQLYDVLLVNSIADGMNLVAKEGPVVNQRDGVLVLSERTGASEQLESGALVISPCDIYATAEALHQALTMSDEERKIRANRLRWLVEENDIVDWFCKQIKEIGKFGY
ncbi:MAG: trehalose-6-phosphate synthase [Anaerolineales bacterium]|nr:trehalose-6-phosphate synthase [Anaerolineales bacterium]